MINAFAVVDAEGWLLAVYGTAEDAPPEAIGVLDWERPAPPAPGLQLRLAAHPGAVAAFESGDLYWADPRSLAELRLAKWEEIKAARGARLAGTFSAIGHLFDVDLQNLTGAALDALMAQQLNEPYAQPWVLADNTVLVLDAAQQITVARACKAYVAGLWAISVQLRAAIDATADAQALAAIAWPTP